LTFYQNILNFVRKSNIIMSYCIIKNIKVENKDTNIHKILPVILLDNQDEVLEFENFDEAEKFRVLLQKNSDSNHEYLVKQI
jgi:hypothetical protein